MNCLRLIVASAVSLAPAHGGPAGIRLGRVTTTVQGEEKRFQAIAGDLRGKLRDEVGPVGVLPAADNSRATPARYAGESRLELVFYKPATVMALERAGYVFSGGRLNTPVWIFHRKVTAGAVPDFVDKEHAAAVPAFNAAMRVIHRIPDLPHSAVCARRGPGAPLVRAITAALGEMADHQEGRAALRRSPYRRFVPFAAEDAARIRAALCARKLSPAD
ncbi:MAG: phosphate/phosphite/phosphonate ABC transporter substrate-binding protein [Acidobacteria bacterium]|nr:phosphate/phosphite/phosphonate ABC transporter substrate-binding protein [Acidobacteriota bacterium]